MNEQEREELFEKVVSALRNLLDRDRQLLEVNASERSISHKLVEHLQHEFSGWHVDCEYNRLGSRPKYLQRILFQELQVDDQEAKTIFPDIIVHRRAIEDNFLVVEVKKVSGRGREVDSSNDEIKLTAFTDPTGEYRYEIGLFIVFDVERQALGDVRYFERGEKVTLAPVFRTALEALGYGG